MSIKHGDTKIEVFYVGTQPRKVPIPGEKEAHGEVFTITKDNKEYYGSPYITLVSGNTYKFVINTPGYPFYITTDPVGAGVIRRPSQSLIGAITINPESTSEKGNVGIEKGELTFTPDRLHADMKIYYQSNFHKNMGNEIIVRLPE